MVNGPPPLRPSAYVGIDPGFKGAIGVIDTHSRFLRIYDMPVKGAAGRGQEIDTSRVCGIASEIGEATRVVGVYLEWPSTRPDESAESSKRFGVGMGILEAAFTAYVRLPVRVAPNKWKGRLGLTGKKDNEHQAREDSVRLAGEFIKNLPPDTLHGPRGGLLDGRAEALLIAWEALTSTREGLEHLDPDTRLARLVFSGGRRRRKPGMP